MLKPDHIWLEVGPLAKSQVSSIQFVTLSDHQAASRLVIEENQRALMEKALSSDMDLFEVQDQIRKAELTMSQYARKVAEHAAMQDRYN